MSNTSSAFSRQTCSFVVKVVMDKVVLVLKKHQQGFTVNQQSYLQIVSHTQSAPWLFINDHDLSIRPERENTEPYSSPVRFTSKLTFDSIAGVYIVLFAPFGLQHIWYFFLHLSPFTSDTVCTAAVHAEHLLPHTNSLWHILKPQSCTLSPYLTASLWVK